MDTTERVVVANLEHEFGKAVKVKCDRIIKIVLLPYVYELYNSLNMIPFESIQICMVQLEIIQEGIHLCESHLLLVALYQIKGHLFARLLVF